MLRSVRSELGTFGVKSGISTSTSMSRLEETFMTKMDQQSEQLQQLTSQQAERVDGVVQKLEQTGIHVNAITWIL